MTIEERLRGFYRFRIGRCVDSNGLVIYNLTPFSPPAMIAIRQSTAKFEIIRGSNLIASYFLTVNVFFMGVAFPLTFRCIFCTMETVLLYFPIFFNSQIS